MADLTQETIRFVTSLPLSINPYEALAEKVEKGTRIATPVFWGLVIRRIIACQFFILCGQAIAVLWLRKKANKLHFFRLNKLGLIHVEVLNEIVVLMLVYSALAVSDLVTQEFVELGTLPFHTKLILRTVKFPIGAGVYCIETAMSFSSLRARARAGVSIRLPPHVRYAANGLLLAALTFPVAILLGTSVPGTVSVKRLEEASDEMINLLLKAAPTYQPDTYNYLSLLALIFKPGERIVTETKRFAHYVEIMQIMYLVQHLLIASIYMPTSICAIRGLRCQTISKTALQDDAAEDALPPSYQLQRMTLTNIDTPEQEMAERIKVRKRLIIHAILMYADTVLYCPPLIYMLTYKGSQFFNDRTWVLVEQLGTHWHTAIIGNIMLALLIKNTIYANQKCGKSSVAQKKFISDGLERNMIKMDKEDGLFSSE
ncbi:hypothetical protein PCANC_09312 [Puccinia coronata f. sp. avenae]|uniref:G-protein coupled receptors family 1 profile domain-containing protein n=1 Tax=Puccinia coronata f. sp. avenae TaxID=200324 RepID=A0A2N5T5M8_9BASI|nr:hypothetical protein PCANC_09312 [Puccinia coronata f. sp. avenae]